MSKLEVVETSFYKKPDKQFENIYNCIVTTLQYY